MFFINKYLRECFCIEFKIEGCVVNWDVKMISDERRKWSEKKSCYLYKKLKTTSYCIKKLSLFVIIVISGTGYVSAQEVPSEICADSEPTLYDKIYVISLDRTPERYEYVKKQLDKFNLKHERFSGVDGKLLTIKDEKGWLVPVKKLNDPNEYAGERLKISYQGLYKDAEFFYVRDYLLNCGQLGCAMSHRAVWADVVKHKYKRAIVLEDDVMLEPDFDQKLSMTMKNLPKYYDVFFLNIGLFPPKNRTYFTPPDFWLSKFSNTSSPFYANVKTSSVWGLQSYVITNDSARKLLEKTKYLSMPIDNAIIFAGLNLYISKLKLIAGTLADSVIHDRKGHDKK